MYFVRTPCEWGMDAISATLTFLWEVVGYVEGLFFKDLKQTMKKEQCEVKLLVTASMPGTAFGRHNFFRSINNPFTDQVSLSFPLRLVSNLSLFTPQTLAAWGLYSSLYRNKSG